MNNTYFYRDKPIFGLDIGFSSLKIMQLEKQNKKISIVGYGLSSHLAGAIKEGVVVDHEKLANSINELFNKSLIGDITTNRVVLAIPAALAFTRIVSLPVLGGKDLAEAVRLETEQYVPVPYDELYVDHAVTNKTVKAQDVLVIASPRKIVDSYLQLTNMLGLEVAAIETTVSADTRLFVQAENSDIPTVLIDLGSNSSDLTIYDKGLVVTGTVAGGGEAFSKAIATKLGITYEEAKVVKTKYGLGLSKKQAEIKDCLSPILELMIKEIRKMIRYYEERSGTNRKVEQIITMGGGSNMPGLSDYMTDILRIPVRVCDPTQHIDFGGLQPPSPVEKSIFATVTGLALTDTKEIGS